MTVKEIERTYGIKTNYLELMQIRKNIDKKTLETLTKNTLQLKEYRNSMPEGAVFLLYQDKTIYMEHIKCSELYWLHIGKIGKTPGSFNMWYTIFPRLTEIEDIVWYNILYALKMCVTSYKLQSFQYKIIYNIINCRKKLYEWKIINCPKCLFCAEIDNIDHYFIHCKRTQKFWNSLFNWWNNLSEIEIHLKQDEIIENILFGFNLIDDRYILLNFIILHAKYYIYVCNQTIENEQTVNIDLLDFLVYLKGKLLIEKAILVKTPKAHKRIIENFCDLV
jgi:hypothetical protein